MPNSPIPEYDNGSLDWGNGFGLYTPAAVEKWMKGKPVPGTTPITYDWSGYQQGTDAQKQYEAMLMARAQGRGGPSVAEGQLAQSTAANRAAAQSMAASARGGAMQQQAAQQQAQAQGVALQQQQAQQAATLRAQESAQEMGLYGQSLHERNQLEAQRQLGLGQQQLGYTGAESERIGMQQKQDKSGLGGILGGIGGLVGALSDERAKTDVSSADKQIEDFLSHLAAKKYEYKPGMGDGPGPRVGVMAQDLEKSPVGRALVAEGPDGMKRVDTTRRMPMMLLAAMADIHKRLQGAGL